MFRGNSAVDSARETHTKIDADAVVNGTVHDGLVVGEIEVGEEAERAEREGKNGWDDALEKPGREENGAVATKLNYVLVFNFEMKRMRCIQSQQNRRDEGCDYTSHSSSTSAVPLL